MLNKVILIGRLVRDPELRYTPTEGVAVANFTLAVDRSYVNQKGRKRFYQDCNLEKLAETCANVSKEGL